MTTTRADTDRWMLFRLAAALVFLASMSAAPAGEATADTPAPEPEETTAADDDAEEKDAEEKDAEEKDAEEKDVEEEEDEDLPPHFEQMKKMLREAVDEGRLSAEDMEQALDRAKTEYAEKKKREEEAKKKDYTPGLRALLKLLGDDVKDMRPVRLSMTVSLPGGNEHQQDLHMAFLGRKTDDGALELVTPTGVRYVVTKEMVVDGEKRTFDADGMKIDQWRERLRHGQGPQMLVAAAQLLALGEKKPANEMAAEALTGWMAEQQGSKPVILAAMTGIGAAKALSAAGVYARTKDLSAYIAEIKKATNPKLGFAPRLKKTVRLDLEHLIEHVESMAAAAKAKESPADAVEDAGLRKLIAALAETDDPGALSGYGVSAAFAPVNRHGWRLPSARTDAEDDAEADPSPADELLDKKLDAAEALLALWDDRTPTRFVGPIVSDPELRGASLFSFADNSNGWFSAPLCRGDLARLILLTSLPSQTADAVCDAPDEVRAWIADYEKAPALDKALLFVHGGSDQQKSRALSDLAKLDDPEAFDEAVDSLLGAADPWEMTQIVGQMAQVDEEAAALMAKKALDIFENADDARTRSVSEYATRELKQMVGRFGGESNLARLFEAFGATKTKSEADDDHDDEPGPVVSGRYPQDIPYGAFMNM